MDNLFIGLAILFALGMMLLMVKYAKFIHNQPRIDQERKQNSEKENS